MNQKTLMLIFGSNLFLFLQSLEGFFRTGAAALAFCTTAVSFTLIVYKDRHTIRKILGKDNEQQPTNNDERADSL